MQRDNKEKEMKNMIVFSAMAPFGMKALLSILIIIF